MKDKKSGYFLVCSAVFSCFLPALGNGKADEKGIHIEVKIENSSSNTPLVQVQQDAVQQQECSQASMQQTVCPNGSEQYGDSPSHTSPHALLGIFRRHKLLTIGGIYTALISSLVYARRIFRQTRAWSRWKDVTKLDELRSAPHDLIASELLKEIQLRYLNPVSPLDRTYPLMRFARTVKGEERLLSWYIRTGKIATRLRLGPFFWISTSRIAQAEKQLERLNFLKKTFYSWAAAHRAPFTPTQQNWQVR